MVPAKIVWAEAGAAHMNDQPAYVPNPEPIVTAFTSPFFHGPKI